MVDVLLSAAEIKSAPHHVKEWIKATILEGLALEPEPEQILEKETELVLAECSFDEANLILQQIRDDYIACQVFFELSRDDLREHLGPPDLHRSPIAHILSHTRLSNPKHFSI